MLAGSTPDLQKIKHPVFDRAIRSSREGFVVTARRFLLDVQAERGPALSQLVEAVVVADGEARLELRRDGDEVTEPVVLQGMRNRVEVDFGSDRR